jgi:L-threonylcarbamoyladenylate synthase
VKTKVARADASGECADALAEAVALLHAEELVALPTETVYGLAAAAFSEKAVTKIFETKERPRFDPLIVHLPDRDWLERVAELEPNVRTLVDKLVDRFWPGPLTLLLPRTSLIPDIVTAGLTSVAVRMSAHPIFSAVIQSFGKPLAAPSANRFGRISPTSAQHVLEELANKIPLIVDGGATTHGIESTIISIGKGALTILRDGPISEEELSEFSPIKRETTTASRPAAPGQLRSHYAPRTPLVIVEDISQFAIPSGQRCGALIWSNSPFSERFVEARRLSRTGDLREAAVNLFRYLRELDHADLDCIVAEAVPARGIGFAIKDRLERAAHR